MESIRQFWKQPECRDIPRNVLIKIEETQLCRIWLKAGNHY